MRYEIERLARWQASQRIDRELQEFLNALTDEDRARIREYVSHPEERAATISIVRRRLAWVLKDFNLARCKVGRPATDNGYPSRDTCVDDKDDDLIKAGRPTYYRALRLFADQSGLYVEGELRSDSRKHLIPAKAGFPAGDYLIRVTLGDSKDEDSQIRATREEFNLSGFADYLDADPRAPPECKTSELGIDVNDAIHRAPVH